MSLVDILNLVLLLLKKYIYCTLQVIQKNVSLLQILATVSVVLTDFRSTTSLQNSENTFRHIGTAGLVPERNRHNRKHRLLNSAIRNNTQLLHRLNKRPDLQTKINRQIYHNTALGIQ